MKLGNFKQQPLRDYGGTQVLLKFGDQYELSVVSHQFSYGGKKGLYEIGVFKNDNMIELPGITEEGDTVKGFLSEKDVDSIIKKLYTITKEDPVQSNV